MARYTKRPDGRYMTHVNIGFQEDGRPRRKTIYAKTIRELEGRVAETRKQAVNGIFTPNNKMLVSEWASEWLKVYKSGLEPNTYKMYRIMVDAHIIPALGLLLLTDVKPHDIQKIINAQAAGNHIRTAEKIFLTVKQIFKKAYENNLITRNPADNLEKPRKDKNSKRALSQKEIGYINHANIDKKGRAFLYTLLYSGLRRGEALALCKSDINIAAKTITVNKNLTTVGNSPVIKPSPKSKAGYRTIPIPDLLINVLVDYLPDLRSDYMFPSAKGTLMSAIAFRRFWEKIIRNINIAAGGSNNVNMLADDITPHIFRHTYATMLYYAGVDIKTAQYLLGHANVTLTMEIYTHLDMGKTKCAVDKLNSFIITSSQEVVKC